MVRGQGLPPRSVANTLDLGSAMPVTPTPRMLLLPPLCFTSFSSSPLLWPPDITAFSWWRGPPLPEAPGDGADGEEVGLSTTLPGQAGQRPEARLVP